MDRLSLTRRTAGEATSPRDQIFAEPAERVADFDFGAKTAAVFDDMLGRSVPFYDEIQRMTGELAADYAAEGTSIYDLGCSTGTTILKIGEHIPRERNVRFVGVDNSPELEFACGLGTISLLEGDVCAEPLSPVDGYLPVLRQAPEPTGAYPASAEVEAAWAARLARVRALT